VPDLIYPLLIDATGRCPPEDVGGPWGYAEFLETMADPQQENHVGMTEWADGPFDPDNINIDDYVKAVAALAKAWARKPVVKRKPAV
jgi:hypothetical protein